MWWRLGYNFEVGVCIKTVDVVNNCFMAENVVLLVKWKRKGGGWRVEGGGVEEGTRQGKGADRDGNERKNSEE